MLSYTAWTCPREVELLEEGEEAPAYPRRLMKGMQRPVQPGWLKGCGHQAEGTERWVMEGAFQVRLIEGKLLGCLEKAGKQRPVPED